MAEREDTWLLAGAARGGQAVDHHQGSAKGGESFQMATLPEDLLAKLDASMHVMDCSNARP